MPSGSPIKWRTSRKLLLGFGLLIFIVALITLISYQKIQNIDKDVVQVVDVAHNSGIAKKVVKLRPLISIKG